MSQQGLSSIEEEGVGGLLSMDVDGTRPRAGRGCVVVAGMHRSGTSVVTRVVSLLGYTLPSNLIPPHPCNPKGYWESQEIVNINREILVSAGATLEEWRGDEWRAFDSRWYASAGAKPFRERAQAVLAKEFGNSRLFVLKDPRICRLLPFWIEALESFGAPPFVVCPVRNPLDVAESLEKRDGIPHAIGLLMWLQHVLAAEAASRSVGRLFLRYDNLLLKPQSTMEQLRVALNTPFPEAASGDGVSIDEHVFPSLRHHRHDDAEVLDDPGLSEWIRRSFEILNRWTRNGEATGDRATLDRIRASFNEAMTAFDPAVGLGLKTTRWLHTTRAELADRGHQLDTTRKELADRSHQLDTMRKELADRSHQLDAVCAELADREQQIIDMLASKSWRLTKPLRTARALVGRVGVIVPRSVRLSSKFVICLNFAWKFILHSRAFGLPSACQRAKTVILTRARLGQRAVPCSDYRHLEASMVSRRIQYPKSNQQDGLSLRIGMLVAELHDGGLEMWVINVTRQLQSLGFDCPILVVNGTTASETILAEAKDCQILMFKGDLARLVSTVLNSSIEVLLTHHCYDGLKQLAKQGVKVIEVVHNSYYWQRDNPRLMALRHTTIYRFITVSDCVCNYFHDSLTIRGDRIKVIDNGLSRHGLIRPQHQILAQRRKASIEHPLLVHVANTHPQKNHIAVLRAFARVLEAFPTATLALVGNVNKTTPLGRRVCREINDIGLQSHVRLAGTLNRRQMSHLYVDAHVGLLPSIFEGSSLAALEYTYFALPAILSDTGSAQSLAKRYAHVVIAENVAFRQRDLQHSEVKAQSLDPPLATVESITTAIITALSSYDQLAESAYRAATDWKSYSMSHMVQQYLDTLRGAVS